MKNACGSCQDLRLFALCKCEAKAQLPPISCQIWEKLDYVCKDGTVKSKSDFVAKKMPYSKWESLFIAYWPKFMLHHDVGKWQDDETNYLKSHLQRETTFEIQDFGENYHIERKREHQSFYFCEIGVSLYGCMLRIRVEDLSEEFLGAGEKKKLLTFFAQLGKPPVVLIAHIIVSEDLSHDNAFVQHVNSRIIWDWLQKVMAPDARLSLRILCTDGAPQQYKLAEANMGTPRVRHIFRGTAHGKDDSDPETSQECC